MKSSIMPEKFFQLLRLARFVLLLCAFLVIVPHDFPGPPEKIYLLHADKLENLTHDSLQVKMLTGNILIKRGTTTLQSERAFYIDLDKKVEFFTKVQVKDGSNQLLCDSLTLLNPRDLLIARGMPLLNTDSAQISARILNYNLRNKVASAFYQVKLQDSTRSILADSAHYYTNEKLALFYGKVLLLDTKENNRLEAGFISYNQREQLLLATESPVLTMRDSLDSLILKVVADTIVFRESAGLYSALHNVRVFRDDLQASCEKLDYFTSDSTAFLHDKSTILQRGRELSGIGINIKFHRGQLKRMDILKDARAISRAMAYDRIAQKDSVKLNPRPIEDELSSRKMTIFFVNGKIDSIVLAIMATSKYHVLDEDSIYSGVNNTSGDSIFISFKDEKLNFLKIKGGCLGRFVPSPYNQEVDTVINYQAEVINYFIPEKITNLIEQARVEYGDASLMAGSIRVEWQRNMLYASPLEENRPDSLRRQSYPTLIQKGKEPFIGEWMAYNMKTQRGKIVYGRTELEDGFYQGRDINKVGKEVFLVRDGIYTTCDLDTAPHYYFKSSRMKLIKKDKIIAKPIILYIADIPLLGLPWGVFPDRSGRRHSGWLMPSYGENKRSGGFLKGLGYYFAPNDYYDLLLTTDFSDKQGVILKYRWRYAWRYHFSGYISGSYNSRFLTLNPGTEWNLHLSHRQPLSPTSNLIINGNFVSSEDYLQRTGYDRATRLKQEMVSSASYSKRWPNTPFSFSANARQIQVLNTSQRLAQKPTRTGIRINRITRTLPGIRFSISHSRLIPLKERASKREKWYHKIYFNFNSNFTGKQQNYYLSELINDSLQWVEKTQSDKSLVNNLALSQAHTFLGWLTINQSLSLRNNWIFRYRQPQLSPSGYVIYENGKIQTFEVQRPLIRVTGSYNLRAQTKIYGLFPLQIGNLIALRHVITPAIGYNYTPDFSKPILGFDPGYFFTGTDSSGKKVTYDLFSGTPAGATPANLQQRLTFNISNDFQIKTIQNGKEKKRSFLTINTSGSYNFAADSMRLSTLITSIRTKLTQQFALKLNMTHNFYRYDPESNRRINRWYQTWNGLPLPQPVSVSISTGFQLSDRSVTPPPPKGSSPDTTSIDTLISGKPDQILSSLPRFTPESKQRWNLRLSFRYSLNQSNPLNVSRRFFMNLNLNLKLTDNWKIGYSARFDLVKKSLINHDFHIYRDLHCWELNFSWTPSGYGKQYLLTINVKSPNLRDLKYEERGGRRAYPGL